MASDAIELLKKRYVLFSCEGSAEGAVIQVLYDNDLMVVPCERVVMDAVWDDRPYTRLRKASAIAGQYFGVDYAVDGAEGLAIARIVDSRAPKFELPRRQQNGTEVVSFVTRPEIEMLLIHAEGAYKTWLSASKKNRQLKPSDFCKQQLGLSDVKEMGFLKEYWADSDKLVWAIREHARCAKRRPGEYLLLDLLSERALWGCSIR